MLAISDAAVASIVTGVVTVATMLITLTTLYLKLRYGEGKTQEAINKTSAVEKKIDDNTRMTEAAKDAAATSAAVAVKSASEARIATAEIAKNIDKKLNGGVDAAIEGAVKPLRDALQDHVMRYESDMKEIRVALVEISKRSK